MKGKTLLIIDAQHDFIDGSLAVEGAKETMDRPWKWLSPQKNY